MRKIKKEHKTKKYSRRELLLDHFDTQLDAIHTAAKTTKFYVS